MAGLSSGAAQFMLTYQLSPIMFVGGGVGGSVPGGMVPIISYTQGQDFDTGLLSQSNPDLKLDDYFAHFMPLTGSTLIDYAVGGYPFINQTTAANALIANPLKLSMLMTCPVRGDSPYSQKLSTLTALQSTIASHIAQGGLFNVATPAFLYTNVILTAIRDVTQGESPQVQYQWVWEFVQPLVTLVAAQAAENTQMKKISSLTGPLANASVGQPASGATPGTVPAASGLGAAGATGVNAPTTQV